MRRRTVTTAYIKQYAKDQTLGQLHVIWAYRHHGCIFVSYCDVPNHVYNIMKWQSFYHKCNRYFNIDYDWVVPKAIQKHVGEREVWVKARCAKHGHPYHIRRKDVPALYRGELECPVCKGLREVDEHYIDDVMNGRLLPKARHIKLKKELAI